MTEERDVRELRELLEALAQAGPVPDLELIRECLKQREALTPGLLQMLGTNPHQAYDIDGDEDDPRLYAPIHAGYLLIAFGETKAIPLFVDIFADPQRGEHLIEWFVAALHDYGNAAVKPLTNLVVNAEAFTYGRAAATEVLSKIGRLYPETREDVSARLLAFLPEPKDLSQMQEGDEIWMWAGITLADLQVSEALPRMRAIYEAGLAHKDVTGDWEAYRERFDEKAGEVRSFNLLDTYRYLKWRVEQEARARRHLGRRPSSEHARREPGGPTVRTEAKVGRNDPCPCGSGKKYKYCHGRPGA